MTLVKNLLGQIADPNLSTSQRARLHCRQARQLESVGNYEAAREAMGELWQRVGDQPLLAGLNQEAKAEVLLSTGSLTGWIGSTKQIQGAQELAKNLLSESISLFESLEQTERAAEARSDLANCYWREGAFDDARVILQEALSGLAEVTGDVRATALLRSAVVESDNKRYHDALRIHDNAAAFFGSITNNVLKGKFHHLRGKALKNLGTAEQRRDYIDQALIEYAAASIYFEEARLSIHQACVENNLGFLFGTIGKFNEAHEHLDRAQALFTTLKDKVHLAQVDETRARVMLAQKRATEAKKFAAAAVRALEKGGEQSLLAEALTTQGIAFARLGDKGSARTALDSAATVAEQAGDPESAGNALLVIIEEFGGELTNEDLFTLVDRAAALLENTRDMTSVRRLAMCACRALSIVNSFPARPDWTTFCLKEVMQRHEGHFIKLALEEAEGRVTRAAALLGLTSHQTLLFMLHGRHEGLVDARSPVVPRRRSLIGRHVGRSKPKRKKSTSAIKILHVEDDGVIGGVVKETLALEGWEVETCEDGAAAMKKIAGTARYDLLLLDYQLPGLSGVQLAQQARGLAHRRATPIVILSATLDEATAGMAGADAFLRKPEDITAVRQTIARLLQSAKK